MTTRTIGTREEWQAARAALLAQTQAAIEPIIHQLPPVAYHTYSTTGRGVEFLMPYHGILDHAPNGRNEDERWQLWIRRHDEYETESGIG